VTNPKVTQNSFVGHHKFSIGVGNWLIRHMSTSRAKR